MKVNMTFALTDEQRNWISLQRNPRARKRLATRDEIRRFVLDAIAKTGCPANKPRPVEENTDAAAA